MTTNTRTFLVAGAIAFAACRAAAQTRDATLATPTGHEVSVSFGHYSYTEPGDLSITIHGPKFLAAYTGTLSLNPRTQWFAQANVRGSLGRVTYDGWCMPWLITPAGSSPNGYALDFGAAEPCSESGDVDWYVEGRGVVGRDFVAGQWGIAPASGLGLRYLSNGTAGVADYRTDAYLYVPIAVTARTRAGSHGVVAFSVEADVLLRGWQTTRDSKLGGGDVPATPTAPAFTIDGLSDISFDQHGGWALRAGAKYPVSKRWSIEPSFIHWSVSASDVNFGTATFTVNGITAHQQLGAYEPHNITNEFSVGLGFHF
jgi:hypothetical protein